MRTRSPPRLATWLLEGLGSGARLEELIGDLTEQYAAGRSALWYWHQASGALALDVRRTLRTHGPSFATAVLVGYAVTSLWLLGNSLAFRPDDGLEATRHAAALDTLMRFLSMRASQASLTVLVFVSGWIVTRIHRAHRRAVLLAFVIAVIAPRLPANAALIAYVIRDSQPFSLLVPGVVPTALQAVFTLAAGLWIIRTKRFAHMHPRVRFVTVLTIVLALAGSLLYDAWKVGVLTYPPAARYPVDAAEIGSGAYLAYLLWRAAAPSMRTRSETGKPVSTF